MNCPQCRKATDLGPDNPWRPFCSERCKLLDLGEWFEESRGIPGEDCDLPDFDRPQSEDDPTRQ